MRDKRTHMKFALTIQNEKGLHARASAKFVEEVEKYDVDCTVSKGGLDVPGSSIMGLMMLGAAQGDEIDVEITGPDTEKLSSGLLELVNDKFGEGK